MLGVRLIDLVTLPGQPAGAFTLQAREGSGAAATANPGFAKPDDVSIGAAHLGHHLAAEDRAAVAAQPVRLGHQHPRHAALHTATDCGLNIMPLFHIHGLIAGVLAPLSAGSQVFCTPGFQRAEVLRLDGRGQAHLVHRGADDAPGHSRPRLEERRGDRAPPAALPALVVVVVDASAGDPRARGGVQGAAGRGLRHDRGDPPDDRQPAAARPRASPAPSAGPPAPRWRSWPRTARCSALARPAKS